jgi:soluble lytic murein transglycosylase
MILKYFRCFGSTLTVSSVLALAFAAPGLAAVKPDQELLGAYDGYRAGNAMRVARHAKNLDDHVLKPWVDYWQMALRLEDRPTAEVQAFLKQYRSAYVGELLRGDWLRVLGKRRDWSAFDREATLYTREDLEIRCYTRLSRLSRGDETAIGGIETSIWLEPKELPEGCARFVEAAMKQERFSTTLIWQRVRVLFEAGQITAAKTALGYLPKGEAPDERDLAEAARHPKRLLARLPATLERRPAREVAVLAGSRYARDDPEALAKMLEGSLGEKLAPAELKYLWARVAYEGARSHHEMALRWYARAGDLPLNDAQDAWKARAALRRGQWQTVRDSIEGLSAEGRRDPAWTYWYGRALAAQGDETGARAYFLRIAGHPNFYGLLANEELGYLATLPETAYVPTEQDLEAAAAHPGLTRAMKLIRLGLRSEGVDEWIFSIRYFDDHQLLAASQVALREGIYDRAIHTADRTTRSHNYALRYPVPFEEVFREHSKSQGLDEAWVFGLVRQESRFITEARSAAGAAGLMQVMPQTARFVAAKIGLRGYRPKNVTEVKTNIAMGTGYMKIVLDQLGHPVLASAAYNAGPNRARRWRDARPLEGAIYAETIPYAETREYVKRVMANSVFYSALLHEKPIPIKARLGVIPARSGAEPAGDEDDRE